VQIDYQDRIKKVPAKTNSTPLLRESPLFYFLRPKTVGSNQLKLARISAQSARRRLQRPNQFCDRQVEDMKQQANMMTT